MPDPVKWKAWYADGKTYEGEEADAWVLPEDGLLGIMLCYPDGTRRSISGNSVYWIAEGLAGTIFDQAGNGTEILTDAQFEQIKADIKSRYKNAHVIRGMGTDEHTIRRVMKELNEYWGYPPPLKDIMRY